MTVPYAEVIGDPVDHSKSPLIHKFWLEKLGIEGDYRAVRVHHNDLGEFLAVRRKDPAWLGCNVTIPHKIAIIDHIRAFTPSAVAVGAINCVSRDEAGRLVGTNTDVDGVESVLDSRVWRANRVTLIGGGGAARAVLEVMRRRDTLEVFMIVREPDQIRSLFSAFARSGSVNRFDDLDVPFCGSEYLINATPLGMTGFPPMPESILETMSDLRDHAIVFDMVYSPLETELIKRARELSLRVAIGLEMLVGQAAASFERFFGARAPRHYDGDLMDLLAR
ncbi:MAG: shikimate dehydrogenase [Sphingomonadales bacterium]|jgi:shikimate dehydrogenase|nr:shikimate dehydrogenase [Sphingomonadales bacterium]